jgi:hypothetical protein
MMIATCFSEKALSDKFVMRGGDDFKVVMRAIEHRQRKLHVCDATDQEQFHCAPSVQEQNLSEVPTL